MKIIQLGSLCIVARVRFRPTTSITATNMKESANIYLMATKLNKIRH